MPGGRPSYTPCCTCSVTTTAPRWRRGSRRTHEVAAVNAVPVGYLVFAAKSADKTADVLDRVRNAPAEISLVALVLTVIIVIATKAWTGRGTPLRGGLPSGHAAVAFAGWMAATYIV